MSQPLRLPDPWHVSVLIPARDEEELLPRCLQSVLTAREALLRSTATGGAFPTAMSSDIVVVVDCSTDRTFALAKQALRGIGCVLRSHAGVVGAARATAARAALRRSPLPESRTWLANTDADCCVPPTWLIDQLSFAAGGIEALAGIVDVDSFSDHAPHVADRFRTTYLLHEDGTHPHVHGANLGVRADAYLRAGGWTSLSTAEDHHLWSRLGATGARRQSSTDIEVLTSGRRVGRAPFGFAGALAAHNEATA
jgi:glycosyltransferase involved in cell wall biosynthesis